MIFESSFRFAASRLSIFLLFLGIAVYAGLPYSNIPFDQHWPVKASQTSVVFDLLFALSNYFRMPLLILLGGYVFSLIGRHPAKLNSFFFQYLKTFVFALLLVIPLALAGFAYYESGMGNLIAFGLNIKWLTIFSRYSLTLHIWYIYYLILFVSLVCLLRTWQNNLSKNINKLIVRLILLMDKLMAEVFGKIILLIMPTSFIIILFESNLLEAGISLIPDPRVFIGHFLFFIFGSYLARSPNEWLKLSGQWKKWLVLFLLLFPVNLALSYLRLSQTNHLVPLSMQLMAAISYAICVWSSCFALLGIFARFFNQPSKTASFSKASARACYILHVPIVIWLPIFLDSATPNIWTKLIITLLLILFFCYSVNFLRSALRYFIKRRLQTQ